MALTITSATNGYDVDGVNKLKDRIHAEVIDKAAEKLENNRDTLLETVDEIWHGDAAESFKKNIKSDVAAVVSAIDDSWELLYNELRSITSAMQNADDQLIKER